MQATTPALFALPAQLASAHRHTRVSPRLPKHCFNTHSNHSGGLAEPETLHTTTTNSSEAAALRADAADRQHSYSSLAEAATPSAHESENTKRCHYHRASPHPQNARGRTRSSARTSTRSIATCWILISRRSALNLYPHKMFIVVWCVASFFKEGARRRTRIRTRRYVDIICLLI